MPRKTKEQKNLELVQNTAREFKYIKDRRSTLEEKWISYYKKLYMYKDLTVKQLNDIELGIKSDIRIARYISNAEIKRPRIISKIWSYTPIIKAIIESDNSQDSYKMYELLINKYIRENLYVPFDLALSQMMYLGTGCFMMKLAKIEVDGTTMDAIDFEFCDMFNTYVPDTVLQSKHINVVYRRFLKRRSYLQEQEDKGVYDKGSIAKIDPLGPGSDIILNNAYIERMNVLGLNYGDNELGAAYGIDQSTDKDEKDDIIEVVEKWTSKQKTAIANRQQLIKKPSDHQYGFLNFYFMRNYRNDAMFYGMGEIEVLGGVPAYIDEMKNMRMDITRRIAYPAQLISRNARIPKEDLVQRPQQIIRTYDMEGYRPIDRGGVNRGLVDEEFIGKQDQQDQTGHWSYMAGGPAPRAETATTGLNMREAGEERANTVLHFMCKDVLEGTARDMSYLIKKKFKNGAWVNLASVGEYPSPKLVKTEDLIGIVSWVVSAFEIKKVADTAEKQDALGLFRELKDAPEINQFELKKSLLETFNIKNLDELMIKGPKQLILELMNKNKVFADMMTIVSNNPGLIDALNIFMAKTLQNVGVPETTEDPSDNENGSKNASTGRSITAGGPAPGNMTKKM